MQRAALSGGDLVDAANKRSNGPRHRNGSKRVNTVLGEATEKLHSQLVALSPAVGEPGSLTELQCEFVRLVASGLSPTQAARQVGYSDPRSYAGQLMMLDKIKSAIAEQRAQYEEAGKLTKAEVVEGFKGAIERAKLIGEPLTEIAGWRELAKLAGYYEQTTRVEVSVTGDVTLRQLQQMSDAELLKLVEGEIIDGEAVKEGE